MSSILLRLPGLTMGLCRNVARRLFAHGPRSAWICLKAKLINVTIRLRYRLGGPGRVSCPCCGWEGAAFLSLDCGQFVVYQTECPHCGNHERHRFLHLFLTRRPPAFMSSPGRILHFAPELSIRRHAPEQSLRHFIDQNKSATCISTDYAKGIYQEMLVGVPKPVFISDIHHMPLAENAINGTFCLHVLEHVADDREAIRNLHHITAPGGEAIIMVPFMMDQTKTEEYDGPDPELFDHVRGYSPCDFKDRLAPFTYEEITPSTLLTPEEVTHFQIPDSQAIYLCRK